MVTFTDGFGESHTYAARPVTAFVSNPPPVEVTISSSSRSFSPNADGQEDTIDVEYCVSAPTDVNAVITDAEGALVATLPEGDDRHQTEAAAEPELAGRAFQSRHSAKSGPR